MPSLENRSAECTLCDRLVPSSEKLAFFEYMGEGSRKSKIQCKHCAYYDVAHNGDNARVCNNFEPHGAFENDRYYCGCRGWD